MIAQMVVLSSRMKPPQHLLQMEFHDVHRSRDRSRSQPSPQMLNQFQQQQQQYSNSFNVFENPQQAHQSQQRHPHTQFKQIIDADFCEKLKLSSGVDEENEEKKIVQNPKPFKDKLLTLTSQPSTNIPVHSRLELACPFWERGVYYVSFGEIPPDPSKCHTVQSIYPIGFTTQTVHQSFVNPSKRVTYESEVFWSNGSKFRVTAKDAPEEPFEGYTTTQVWKGVEERIAKRQSIALRSNCSINGDERFGLTAPKIAKAIEKMDNADKCERYKWKYLKKPFAVSSLFKESNTSNVSESTPDERTARRRDSNNEHHSGRAVLTPAERFARREAEQMEENAKSVAAIALEEEIGDSCTYGVTVVLPNLEWKEILTINGIPIKHCFRIQRGSHVIKIASFKLADVAKYFEVKLYKKLLKNRFQQQKTANPRHSIAISKEEINDLSSRIKHTVQWFEPIWPYLQQVLRDGTVYAVDCTFYYDGGHLITKLEKLKQSNIANVSELTPDERTARRRASTGPTDKSVRSRDNQSNDICAVETEETNQILEPRISIQEMKMLEIDELNGQSALDQLEVEQRGATECTLQSVRNCQVQRSELSYIYDKSYFGDWIIGRLVGIYDCTESGQTRCIIGDVVSITRCPSKYDFYGMKTDIFLNISHGGSILKVKMDKVSNRVITEESKSGNGSERTPLKRKRVERTHTSAEAIELAAELDIMYRGKEVNLCEGKHDLPLLWHEIESINGKEIKHCFSLRRGSSALKVAAFRSTKVAKYFGGGNNFWRNCFNADMQHGLHQNHRMLIKECEVHTLCRREGNPSWLGFDTHQFKTAKTIPVFDVSFYCMRQIKSDWGKKK